MYKGREGQWAFVLHRLSGLAILLYLMIHVFSIGSMIFGENFYMTIHRVYEMKIFTLGLIGVTAGVAYHAFNGLRIILMDFTGFGVRVQRQSWYGVLVLTALFTGYAAWVNILRMMGGHA